MITKKMTIILFVALFSLAGCKKDEVSKTTSEKILGKWNLSIVAGREYFPPNTDFSYNQTGKAGEYFDFRSDGKVYLKFDKSAEESETYTVDSDTQITIAGSPYTIQQLTDNQLVIYNKSISQGSSNSYIEETITLTR